jgi:uncharacterized protein YllA (UPF0747 family)
VRHTLASVDANFATLEQTVVNFDKTLLDAVQKAQSRIHHQMEQLQKKVVQAHKKRDDVMRQQLYKAGNTIYPEHKLQERVLNIVPYLFKYGFEFIDRIYAAMDISDHDHQVINIQGK